ncbi:PEF-CTERM sorting domain-containing protein [Methanolobus sp. ZRKC5]|uniref:PEF-CTERM sorting domain-containing protein n=1 Tax=unclassified Methanolobus TaxID=2629569 RepID=UPI00313CC39F
MSKHNSIIIIGITLVFMLMFAGGTAIAPVSCPPVEPLTATNTVNTMHTITVTEVDPGDIVTFDVQGANKDGGSLSASSTGVVVFSYTGTFVGDDTIQVSVADSGGSLKCTTTVYKTWISEGGDIPEFSTIALPVVAILGLAFYFQRRKE